MNIYELYLRIALWLGFTSRVYRLTSLWGRNYRSRGKYAAAWKLQETLIEDYGYFECPSCGWATEQEDEHLKVLGWCFEQQLAHEIRQGVIGLATTLVENAMSEARAIAGMEPDELEEFLEPPRR